MGTTNLPPPPARRRRSSGKLNAVHGVWSVRLPDGTYLKDAEGMSEPRAWDKFLHYHSDADLMRGMTVVASRNHTSPTITRQVNT
jgi:hypothetical protein